MRQMPEFADVSGEGHRLRADGAEEGGPAGGDGGECRRVRSRGWRGSGERRAESWAYAEVVVVVVVGEEVGGGLGGV